MIRGVGTVLVLGLWFLAGKLVLLFIHGKGKWKEREKDLGFVGMTGTGLLFMFFIGAILFLHFVKELEAKLAGGAYIILYILIILRQRKKARSIPESDPVPVTEQEPAEENDL